MTGTTRDHVLAFLIPIFLTGMDADRSSARQAAIELLESYAAASGNDLLMAAEIVAFSFATLDSLGKSIADPQISISTRLRLRSNANALSRAADRNRQALERERQKRPETVAAVAEADSLPSAIQKVRDAIVQAAPRLAETLTQSPPPMSRQQRRFAMRKAEQARAAQQRDARKAARLTDRAAVMTSGQTNGTQDPRSNPEAHQLQTAPAD